MPKLITPKTSVKIIPRDGEIEITLNINISIDGQITAQAENAKAVSVEQEKVEEEKSPFIVPDFGSGFKLAFGKTE